MPLCWPASPDRKPRLISKDAIEAGGCECGQFTAEITVGSGVVTDTAIHRQKMIFCAESPGMDRQPGSMGIIDKTGRQTEAVTLVARNDQ